MEAAATGSPKLTKMRLSGSPKADLDRADRDRAGKRLHPVLQQLELLDNRGTDNIRPCREELAELDIGRPEPADRARKIGKTARSITSALGPVSLGGRARQAVSPKRAAGARPGEESTDRCL